MSACLVMFLGAPIACSAQDAKPREYAQEYMHSFRAGVKNREAFATMGPKAQECVTFNAEGMRIRLPAGFAGTRPATGVFSAFGIKGDFEITLRYEILAEPEQMDAGPQTRFALSVTLNRAPPQLFQAALNRRVSSKNGAEYYPWQMMNGKNSGLAIPTKVKSGQLRLVRTGAALEHWAAEGDDPKFKLLWKQQFGADDIRGVTIVGSTGGPAATLDVRVSDLRIRADVVPTKIPPLPVNPVKVDDPPVREYAQKYAQSFKGLAKPPDGWEYLGPVAERCVHFEPAGVRVALPAGWKNERGATGLNTPMTIKGNFEITTNFEILDAPEPINTGTANTRLSLGIFKDTQRANVATVSRSISLNNGHVFVAWQSLWNDDSGKQNIRVDSIPTDAKIGRLRVVRDGGDLYYCVADGLDARFRTLQKYAFGEEDLKDVRIAGSTGGENATLDVRFSDLVIRAEGLPGAPAPGEPVAPGDVGIQPPPSRAWLMATLIIGGVALLLVTAIGVVGFLAIRKRHMTANVVNEAATAKTSASHSIPCSGCGKKLKCTSASAGTKIKCPHCGKSMLVPTAAPA